MSCSELTTNQFVAKLCPKYNADQSSKNAKILQAQDFEEILKLKTR